MVIWHALMGMFENAPLANTLHTHLVQRSHYKAFKMPFSILRKSKLKTVSEQNLNALNVCSHSLELMLHTRR